MEPDWYWHFTGYDIATSNKAERQKLAMLERRALLPALSRDYVILTSGDYEEGIRYLFEQGVGPHPDHVLTRLEDIPKGQAIRPYTGAAGKQWKLVKQYGITLNAPAFEICRTANDKGTLQHLRNNDPICDEFVPKGWVVGTEGLRDAVRRIHALGSKARVKVVNSASGIGQVVLGPDDDIVAPRVRDTDDALVVDFVVQEEVKREFDASVQFFVTKQQGVNAETVTGQHIEDGRRHVGNFYPWDLFAPRRRRTALSAKMRTAAEAVVNHLVRDHLYFGFGSVDFVGSVTEDKVWAIEVNARVTAAFYPVMACRRWYRKVIPFDMRSFRVRGDVGWSDLKRCFHPVRFDRAAQYGYLPFCLLPQQGVCHGVAFAPTANALLQLVEEVENRKKKLQ